MPLKLFYLTTEISPFASTSHLGDYSVLVPLSLQTKGHDVRTMIPKYGFVSERKYILREVIRLREIPFDYDGEEVITSAKSAFIPKTRVQVYFLENTEWYKSLTNLLYKAKNGRILADNAERYGYFSKAAIATLPHLFWKPDVIICNGWQSSLVPLIYQQVYDSQDFYGKIKTVLTVHSVDELSIFSRSAYDKVGVTLPDSIKGDTVNCYEAAAPFADLIVAVDSPSNDVTAKLLELPGIQANKKKLVSISIDDEESPNFHVTADALNEELTKHFA
ncbi:MAG: glycogen/starch synthase [Candidatus Marinimicrobia bacterium]|jgi:starch synthase|nr:glycogen/starch synthase [Candidatus Neomarinimicrobiota bacterium]